MWGWEDTVVWVLGAALAAGVTGDPKVAASALFLFAWWVRRSRPSGVTAALFAVTVGAFALYGFVSVAGFRRDLSRVCAAAAGPGGRGYLEGWVCGFPGYRYGGMTFDFRTRVDGVVCVVRVRTKEFAVSYGDSLRVDGVWKLPEEGSRGAFERRLIGQGVCGDFRVAPGGVERLGGMGGSWVTRRILSPCHDRLRRELSRGLGSNSGFPIAVFLGETGYLERRSGNAFTALGITHLIALSGQHLYFIAGAVMILLRLVRRRSSALLLFAISLYVGVVGFIVSLWRSFVMVLVLALAAALRRPLDPVKVLGEAFVIVLLFFPNTYYAVGFQLSFLATLALLLCVRGLRPGVSKTVVSRVWFWVRSSLEVSVAAQLIVTPVLIHYFDRVSVLAPIATLVFVFPVAFVLLFSGFAAISSVLVPVVGPVLFAVLDRVVAMLEQSVVVSASLVPGTVSPPPPEPCLYYAGLAFLAYARGHTGRKVAGWSLLAVSFAIGAFRGQLF